jgi:diguanylate cyclase (GGDEF)-like protein
MQRKAVRNWSFSFKVLLPVAIAIAVLVLMAGGFIAVSTMKSNERALDRQTRLFSHIAETTRSKMADESREQSTWDQAIEALGHPLDMDWISENMGANVYAAYNYNRIYILDPDLRPAFAMREGGEAPPNTFSDDSASIQPIARTLQTVDSRSAIAAYNNGFGEVPVAIDVAIVSDKPALIAVVPVVAESDELMVPPDRTFFHVIVRFLDEAIATELSEQFMLDGAHFSTDPKPADGEAVVPMTNTAGQPVAYMKWLPDRPGAQILAETLPGLIANLVGATLVIALLMWRLQRSSAELETARAEAHHRALHDPLTGLANRAMFQERLTQALEALGKGSDPIALLALDLDRFKHVNDTLGHEAGDELLRQVSRRLKDLLRDEDTLARLGGDEFVILQSAIKTVKDAGLLSDRIISRVSEPYRIAGTDVRIGVSIGVAVASEAGRDGLDLPARADFALYQAKESGRNQYKLYEEQPPSPANPAQQVA